MPIVKPIARAVRHGYIARPVWGDVDLAPEGAITDEGAGGAPITDEGAGGAPIQDELP